MSAAPYPDYKDFGISWLGSLPSHWRLKQLKHVAAVIPSNVDKHSKDGENSVSLCNYTDVYYRDRITDDIDFMRATASRSEIERFRLLADDVVITKDSETADDIGVPSYVPDALPGVICGYHLSIIRPTAYSIGRFLKYVLLSDPTRYYFEISAKGLTRVGLSQGALGDTPVPTPPRHEQEVIADFLDHETARIDALIEEQQRLIELLSEKRQSVLSRAATLGLTEDAPTKDSGFEWLGQIPTHWDVAKLGHYARLQSGFALGNFEATGDSVSVPYLRVANVQDGSIDLTDVKYVEVPASIVSRYSLRNGDVLMNEGGDNNKLGRGAVWKAELEPCLHQNHVFSIRPSEELLAEWLSLFTKSNSGRAYFYLFSKQSTNLASISSTNIMNCPLPLPPVDEQRQVLDRLKMELDRLDRSDQASRQLITLLKERRQALISACVTGKIDVRKWEHRLPATTEALPQVAEQEGRYG